MIGRLWGSVDSGGSVSGADANFYNHEITESDLMGGGMAYEQAHAAPLELHGASPFSLYHPDVIQQFPEYFNEAYRAHWGLP
jgi:filamentous hemagglutinin